MGKFINIGNGSFSVDCNSDYVDMSRLISVVNRTLNTARLFSCVTRPRRFGKSMAAHMLNAYYDESCDSRSLFDDLEISKDPSFLEHLNRYPVIYIDMADFTTNFSCDDDIVSAIKISLKKDIAAYYRDVDFEGEDVLVDVLVKVCECIGKKFIIIIDEWDSILREYGENRTLVDNYIRFLRSLFKSEKSYRVFAGAYLTGILPIKKYKTESALNNFEEYSMVDPADMACYFGFTCEDVEKLAQKYNADKEELRLWYDGYKIGGVTSLHNPYSVIKAVQRQRCMSYWSASGSYDSVKSYIQMNFDGLKDDIVKMLSGENCKVNPSKFQNDMSIINSKDDVFTVLIHLGYLGYDRDTSTCYIPNRELFEVLSNAIGETSWKRLSDALTASEHLLYATLNRDEKAVALGVVLHMMKILPFFRIMTRIPFRVFWQSLTVMQRRTMLFTGNLLPVKDSLIWL